MIRTQITNRASKGFTFVELSIVVAIIAILAAIAVPTFLEAKTRAAVSRSKSELALLNMAVNSYRLEEGTYPLNATPGKVDLWDLKVLTTPVVYLSRLPMDTLTTQEARGEKHARALNPIPYHYYNALQHDPQEGLRFLHPETNTHLPGFAAALLWGYGPASALRADPGEAVTQIHPEGEVQILPYDPTNGTTSAGDIYQTVP